MPSIDGLFSCGYDVIVFVDEGIAGHVAEDGSRFVFGRAISRLDRQLARGLSQLLAVERAEAWHSSERGRSNLFVSTRFDEVVESLRALDSVTFDIRSTPTDLMRQSDKYAEALSAMPELRRDWPSNHKVSHEVLLLYAFLFRAALRVAWMQNARELPGHRTLIICDRQSWWGKRPGWYREIAVPQNFSALEAGYSCEVRSLVDKTDPEAVDVLRWVNLIDSEQWAIGRLLRAKTADGMGARMRISIELAIRIPLTGIDIESRM